METFSALLALCAWNSPVTGELLTQRPVTRSFDVFFDLRLNKRLSKQSWCWWFETLSRSLWRHCNGGKVSRDICFYHGVMAWSRFIDPLIITLRQRQNGRHFADDIFKCIFLNENGWISLKISLKFVPKVPIDNILTLVQIMAWGRPGDKPLDHWRIYASLGPNELNHSPPIHSPHNKVQ